jgi:hypothetical protein
MEVARGYLEFERVIASQSKHSFARQEHASLASPSIINWPVFGHAKDVSGAPAISSLNLTIC